MSHTGRSRAIDTRNSDHPVIAGPGGPTWTFNDWATYPASLTDIERLWTDEDFLYFDSVKDTWYYRITRLDLDKQGTTLKDLVLPVHKALTMSPEFERAISAQPKVVSSVQALSSEIALRIQQPKRLADLWR